MSLAPNSTRSQARPGQPRHGGRIRLLCPRAVRRMHVGGHCLHRSSDHPRPRASVGLDGWEAEPDRPRSVETAHHELPAILPAGAGTLRIPTRGDSRGNVPDSRHRPRESCRVLKDNEFEVEKRSAWKRVRGYRPRREAHRLLSSTSIT